MHMLFRFAFQRSFAANLFLAGNPRLGLIRGLAEENVDPVESDCSAPDDSAGCNCPPKDVTSGKLPNRQQRGHYCDEDT